MKEWIDILKKAKNSSLVPTTDEAAKGIKGGWLEKKGKKRWFVLRDNTLFWFSKEMSPTSDFLKNVNFNGYLDLRLGCVVEQIANSTTSFIISANLSGVSYTLTAKTESEMREWIVALQSAIDRVKEIKKTTQKTGNYVAGWLIKKGKKRFFALQKANNRLCWYLSEKDEIEGKVKGSIALAGCDIMDNQHLTNRPTFLVCTPAGVKYELQAPSSNDTKDWILAIKESISNSLQIPPSTSSSGNIFSSPSNLSFSSSTAISSSSLTSSSNFSTSTNNNNAPATTSVAPETENTGISNHVKMQGWMVKKGKKRYFVLMEELLIWFSEPPPQFTPNDNVSNSSANSAHHNLGQNLTLLSKNINIDQIKEVTSQVIKENIVKDVKTFLNKGMPTTDPLGSISLADCTVVSNDEDYTFAIHTSAHSNRAVNARVYYLRARSAHDMRRWVNALREAIAAATLKLHTSQETENKGTTLLSNRIQQKSGWLIKKGKARWFLAVNDILIWFDKEQSSDLSRNAKGSISLVGGTVSSAVQITGDLNTFLVSSPTGKSLILTAHSTQESQDWISFLSLCIQRANAPFQSPTSPSSTSSTSINPNDPNPSKNPNLLNFVFNSEVFFFFYFALIEKTKSGWVTKKHKKRWLVLKNNFLMWYTPGDENDSSNSNTVSPSSVASSSPRGSIPGSRGSIPNQLSGGAYVPSRSIVKGSITLAGSSVSLATQEPNVSGTSNSSASSSTSNTSASNNNNPNSPSKESDDNSVGSKEFVVTTGMGTKYKFACAIGIEAKEWVNAIHKCIEEANEESERHFIIAEQYYKDLIELIVAPNLVIPAILMKVYQSDEVIGAIVHLFYIHDEHIRLLNHVIYRELIDSGSSSLE